MADWLTQVTGTTISRQRGWEILRQMTLVDEPIANNAFETLDELEEVLFERCRSLVQQQNLIRGLTGFHWWIQIGA